MNFEEFLIEDRGVTLLHNLDIRYDYDGSVLIYHQPSGTLLSKEFIEYNNRLLERYLIELDYNIENMDFAIEHKHFKILNDLKNMKQFRSTVKDYLDEFRELVDRMY